MNYNTQGLFRDIVTNNLTALTEIVKQEPAISSEVRDHALRVIEEIRIDKDEYRAITKCNALITTIYEQANK